MENSTHKGSEQKNVQETWDQNEKNLQNEGASGSVENTSTEAAPESELDRIVKQEASEYDNTNKEDRVLSGDRATVNDDDSEAS